MSILHILVFDHLPILFLLIFIKPSLISSLFTRNNWKTTLLDNGLKVFFFSSLLKVTEIILDKKIECLRWPSQNNVGTCQYRRVAEKGKRSGKLNSRIEGTPERKIVENRNGTSPLDVSQGQRLKNSARDEPRGSQYDVKTSRFTRRLGLNRQNNVWDIDSVKSGL